MVDDERSSKMMMMMISSSSEKGYQTKQEGDHHHQTNDQQQGKLQGRPPSSSTTTSRQWSGFRNPRIVRVSRSFGGKDRHSKVCTIRGLRDRRIRLSVPTAIQLYDLQDRLGLSQPSKVIDWLLDNTKDDIDKLPPLQIPQGMGFGFGFGLGLGHQPPLLLSSNPPAGSQLSSFAPNLLDDAAAAGAAGGGGGGGGMVEDDDHDDQTNNDNNIAAKRFNYNWDNNMDDVLQRAAKSKELCDHQRDQDIAAADHKGKWIKFNHHHQHQQENDQDGNNINICGDYSSGGGSHHQKLFPSSANNINHSSSMLPAAAAGFLNNINQFDHHPNYSYHWEPPSLSLSQFGSHGHGLINLPQQTTENFLGAAAASTASLPSSLLPSLPTTVHAPHQLFFCPPAAASTVPSLFPTYPAPPYGYSAAAPGDHSAAASTHDHHHFQLLSSSMRPFSLNVNAGLSSTDHTQNDDHEDDDQSHADDDDDDDDQDTTDS